MKLADLFIKLGLKSDSFKKGMGEAEKKTNKFANTVKKIGGRIAAAFAVERLASFGAELVKLSGHAEGVRKAFNRIADDKILDRLKESTAGTVSEMELMKRAVMASNFQIPVEQLASLFEFATKRAQETGESVDYLVNSIVLGIGRKSPLILDNLGISAVRLRQELKGVGVEMNTVADIAAAVGKIASVEMSKSGKVIDTNAIKVQNLTAQWEDLKLSIAEDDNFKNLASGGIGILDSAIKGLSGTIEAFKTEDVSLIDLLGGPNAGAVAKIVARQIEELEKERQDSINHIDEETSAYRNQIAAEQDAAEEKKKHGKTIADLKSELELLNNSIDTYGVNQQTAIQNTLKEIEATEKLIKNLTTLREIRTDAPATITSRTETPRIAPEGIEENLGILPLQLDKLNDHIAANTDKAKDQYAEYMADTWAFVDEMKNAAVGFGIDVVDEFGMAFGELARTGEFPADFGKNILSIIGSFISQLGQMLIGLGIASEAFQSLLKSAFTNPVSAGLAIAAGAGLVLLGGAIKGFAKSGPTGSGGRGGASEGFTVTSNPYTAASTTAQSQQPIPIQGVLQGDNIFISNQRNEFKRGIIG